MSIRRPAVAGQFYPSGDRACRAEIENWLATLGRTASVPTGRDVVGLRAALDAGREELVGGIVPHAGWICSGAVAAEVLNELSRRDGVETFVVFGAAHRLSSDAAALWARGIWATPLGDIAIDEELAAAVLAVSRQVGENAQAHQPEHSIEVQVPILQHLAPTGRLLPLLVPHLAPGPAIGLAVAEQASSLGRKVVFIGSTDLTHYGPRYGFCPKGVGPAGLAWAKSENDRRIIDLICRMEADRVGPEARQSQSACGAGAAAATIAACRFFGADRGVLLHHTTSAEVLGSRYGQMDDAVGYAGIVFPRPVVAD